MRGAKFNLETEETLGGDDEEIVCNALNDLGRACGYGGWVEYNLESDNRPDEVRARIAALPDEGVE